MSSAAASALPVATGLEAGEFILRGGCLKKPLLLTRHDFQAKDELQFCKLDVVQNPFLALYLSGLPFSRRPPPLAHSQLSPTLARLRDEAMCQLMLPAEPVVEETVETLRLSTPSEGSPLDQGVGQKATLRGRALLQRRAVLARHPFVSVDFRVGDEMFPMRLMVDATTANPSFEVSSDNFRRLFDWFQLESPERQQREQAASKDPKPSPVARENKVYFRKDKGVFFRKERRDESADMFAGSPFAASAFETPRKRKHRSTRYSTLVLDSSRKARGRPRKARVETDEDESVSVVESSADRPNTKQSGEQELPEF